MSRFGKFNAQDIADSVSAWMTKNIPEMDTATEKTVQTQKKSQDILGKSEKSIEQTLDPKFMNNLLKAMDNGDLPKELFPDDFRSYKNSLWYKVKDPDEVDAVIEVIGKYYEKARIKGRRGDRKGVLKDKVVKDLAGELNLQIDDVLRRNIGDIYNVEQMYGSIELLKRFRVALHNSLKRAMAKGAGDREKIFAMQMTQTYSALTNQIMGARAEIGRSFRILKTMKGSLDNIGDEDQAINDIFDKTEGREMTESKLEALYGIIDRDPTRAAKGAREINLATTRSMLYQVYYNNLLNGVTTQAVNLGAGVIYQHFWHMSRMFGGGYGSIRNKVMGKDTGGLTFENALSSYYGYISSIYDGLRIAGSSFLTGKSIDTFSKIPYGGTQGKITTRNLVYNAIKNKDRLTLGKNKTGSSVRERLENDPEYLADEPYFQVIDSILDFSTRAAPRMMKSGDDFMKYIFYRSQLHTYAYKQVSEEVATGALPAKDFGKRMDEIMNDPSKQAPEIRLESMDVARETVLQRPMDKIGQSINRFLKEDKGGGAAGALGEGFAKVLVPFFNTLYNLTKVGLEVTPGVNATMAMFDIGKLGKMLRSSDPIQRDMAKGHLITSHLLTLPFMLGAMNGYVQGGSPQGMNTQQTRKMQILRNGPQDYSIVIPWGSIDPEGKYLGELHNGKDKSYAIDRLDPLGIFLSNGYAIAQLIESTDDDKALGDAMVKFTFNVFGKIQDSSFATGIADFIEIFTTEQLATDKFVRWGAKSLSNFVPFTGRFGANVEQLFDQDDEGNVIARQGNLPAVFRMQNEEGVDMIFIDNGDGSYDMVPEKDRNLGETSLEKFAIDFQNEIDKKTNRRTLPRKLNYWGEQAYDDPRVGGDWAVTYSPIASRDMPYNREELIDFGLFNEDDFTSLPLMFNNKRANEIANARDLRGFTSWKSMIDIIGVMGEMERLGTPPRNHPNFISMQGFKIPLNADQRNSFIRFINGDFSQLSEDQRTEAAAALSPEYYEFFTSGDTFKDRLRSLIKSEEYFLYGNDDDITDTARSKLINKQINFHTLGKSTQKQRSLEDLDTIPLDGPQRLLTIMYPDLKEKALYLNNTVNKRNIEPLRDILEGN